jgi:hypothetical protein
LRAEKRLASAFEEFILPYDALRTAAPSLVRTTAVKAADEGGCLAFMTANMLAPCFRFSITSTKAWASMTVF